MKKLMYPLAFWFSPLNMLPLPQITGSDWQIKTVWVKSLLLPSLFIYFFCQRCSAMPRRKLRFQTVQSEFQMRCNSMENIKCQSQFCTLRWEGFLTLHWLAHVCAAALLLFSTVHFSVHIFLCFLPLKNPPAGKRRLLSFRFSVKIWKANTCCIYSICQGNILQINLCCFTVGKYSTSEKWERKKYLCTSYHNAIIKGLDLDLN